MLRCRCSYGWGLGGRLLDSRLHGNDVDGRALGGRLLDSRLHGNDGGERALAPHLRVLAAADVAGGDL